MNKTLQDRLVKELRRQGISTMAAANAFTTTFMEDYNAKFAKPAPGRLRCTSASHSGG